MYLTPPPDTILLKNGIPYSYLGTSSAIKGLWNWGHLCCQLSILCEWQSAFQFVKPYWLWSASHNFERTAPSSNIITFFTVYKLTKKKNLIAQNKTDWFSEMRTDQYFDGLDWGELSSKIFVKLSAFVNKNAQEILISWRKSHFG